MKENKKEDQGCGCGCGFEKKIDEMVKDGKKPNIIEHLEKKEEVEEAFRKEEQK